MSETPQNAVAVSKRPLASPSVVRFVEWVAIIAVAVALSLFVRVFVFQTFYIPSGSMEPTLLVGDRIIIDKLAVDFGTINRGDIIVFHAPPAVATFCGGADVDLVKRVVAVPGDRISSSGNNILINGHVLHERWTHNEPFGPSITPQTVKAGNYFVIGDNHDNSCDSRFWGLVPKGNIIGKVFLRVWPLNRLSWI
jgi:signal peptidase I